MVACSIVRRGKRQLVREKQLVTKKGNAYTITTEPLGQAGSLHKTRAIGKE